MPNAYSPKYRRIGIYHHAVLQYRVPRLVDDVALGIELEASRTESHPLIEPYMIAYDTSLAYHHSRAVVYAEVVANISPGVNVDTRYGVRHLSDEARQYGHVKEKELVSQAVVGDGCDGRVAEDDLL